LTALKGGNMANCECLAKCPFFNDKMADLPATAQKIKNRLCLTDNTECARYMIFKKLGRDRVPFDLFPHQIDKAQRILASVN
jgi:hypothetical protein